MTGAAALRKATEWSEKDLLQHVRDLADRFGWLVIHHHRSDHSEAGWPDLFMVRGRQAIAAELKSEKGKLTKAQEQWLAALSQVGSLAIATYVWRPSQLQEIIDILR